MANHKSAKKRAKQNIKKNAVNKFKTSRVKSVIKKVRAAITSKDKTLAQTLFIEAQSLLGKLGKSPAMKKKTSGRKTSRLASQIAKL